jgi:hypothetical protein
MNDTIDDFDIDDRLAAHLRRTLRAVAETVTDDVEEFASAAPARNTVTRHRRWPALALAAVLGATTVGLVAWNRLGDPGEIVRIPIEAALMSGTAAGGGEWWLIPSAVVHPSNFSSPCDHVLAAVDFVSAATNKPGQEWNTGGVLYGEALATSGSFCHSEASWLANPARFTMGSTRLGPDNDPDSAWGYFGAFHPTVTQLEVIADHQRPFVVNTVPLSERRDGPRFAAFTLAPDTRNVTVKLRTADGTTLLEWPAGPGR